MLLERGAQVRLVSERLSEAAAGAGSVVLVAGEAGVGKSAFVAEVAAAARQRRVEVLVGACDALFTPRPLGPFHDIALALGDTRLLELLSTGGSRPELLSRCHGLLRGSRTRLFVVEDLHWSDEATLDLVRFLARRVGDAPAVLVATYRDDELNPHDQLQALIGEIASTARVTRLTLAPLSRAAVETLAASADHRVDADDLYRRTGGNPFFVTEVLGSGGQSMPTGVRDAVLARAARLSQGARVVLDAAAVVPQRVELELLLALAGDDAGAQIDECERRGMLVADDEGVRFRHELARNAVEAQVGAARRASLHRQVLAWLQSRPGPEASLSRLVHHALGAGDTAVILDLAPAAAAQAAELGAHREAAAHYQTAARAAERQCSRADLAALLDRLAHESHLSDQHDAALTALERALATWRELADARRAGAALRLMSRLYEFQGRGSDARSAALESVSTLETIPPGGELAAAYLNCSMLAMAADEMEDAVDWAERALALATQIGDEPIAVDARVNLGAIELQRSPGDGGRLLEGEIRRARAGGHDEALARALFDLGSCLVRARRDYSRATRALAEARAHCEDRGLEAWSVMIASEQALVALDCGDYDGAAVLCTEVLRRARAALARVRALMVLGRVRARRGDPGVWEVLDEAWSYANQVGELQLLAPAAAARLEASLLLGERRAEAAAAAWTALEWSEDRQVPQFVGELSVWLSRAAWLDETPPGVEEPWSSELSGDARVAARWWDEAGCPYESAMAIAWSGTTGEDERREAVRRLQELGAVQAARATARRLRSQGARGLARGPCATTRANPAHLTSREQETLDLLADGLTNAQIAARLFVSVRTVDHHVARVISKLSVANRSAAVAEARRRGLVAAVPKERQAATDS